MVLLWFNVFKVSVKFTFYILSAKIYSNVFLLNKTNLQKSHQQSISLHASLACSVIVFPWNGIQLSCQVNACCLLLKKPTAVVGRIIYHIANVHTPTSAHKVAIVPDKQFKLKRQTGKLASAVLGTTCLTQAILSFSFLPQLTIRPSSIIHQRSPLLLCSTSALAIPEDL